MKHSRDEAPSYRHLVFCRVITWLSVLRFANLYIQIFRLEFIYANQYRHLRSIILSRISLLYIRIKYTCRVSTHVFTQHNLTFGLELGSKWLSIDDLISLICVVMREETKNLFIFKLPVSARVDDIRVWFLRHSFILTYRVRRRRPSCSSADQWEESQKACYT